MEEVMQLINIRQTSFQQVFLKLLIVLNFLYLVVVPVNKKSNLCDFSTLIYIFFLQTYFYFFDFTIV